MKTRTIIIETRWPTRQISENTIEINIPVSDHGHTVTSITPGAIDALQLTDKEIMKAQDAAETAALNALAILP